LNGDTIIAILPEGRYGAWVHAAPSPRGEKITFKKKPSSVLNGEGQARFGLQGAVHNPACRHKPVNIRWINLSTTPLSRKIRLASFFLI